ncbi:ion transporter, partial [Bermanella sp. 47_1433_sub80_T6]
HSTGDGIWWAWVTVTTVGYGDIVPVSTAGRIFGALLILMGIGLFTMLTASFAAFFMAEDEKEIRQQQADNIQKLTVVEQRLMMLEAKLDTLLSDEQKQLAKKHQENK